MMLQEVLQEEWIFKQDWKRLINNLGSSMKMLNQCQRFSWTQLYKRTELNKLLKK